MGPRESGFRHRPLLTANGPDLDRGFPGNHHHHRSTENGRGVQGAMPNRATGLRATPCSRRSESFGRHVPHAAHTSEIFMNEEMLRKSGAPSEPTCLPGRGARGTTHGIPVIETPTLHQPARSPSVPNQPDSEQFRSSAEHATS